MMRKSYLRTATTVVAAASLITSAAVPAFAATDANAELVSEAITNTFVPDEVAASYKVISDIVSDGVFSLAVNATQNGSDSSESFKIDAVYAQDYKAGEQSISGTASVGGVNIQFQEYLNDTMLAIACPVLMTIPVSYNYTNENITGALAGYADQLAMVNKAIRDVRDALGTGFDNFIKINPEYTKQLEAVVADKEFTKIDSKELTAGSTTVNCDGYRLELTQADMSAIFDALLNGPLTENGMTIAQLASLADSYASSVSDEVNFSDIVTELSSASAEIGDLSYDFYVGDGKLREYSVTGSFGEEEGTHTIHMLFEGDEYAWHNTTIKADDEVVVRLTTTEEGSNVTYTLATDYEDAVSFSINKESGDFTLAADGESINGKREVTDDSYAVVLNVEGVNFGYALSNNASVEKITGETLEVTTASEEELQSTLGTLISMFTGE
ncbi:MAG: hypothetical protein Q4B09_00730 [Lachnospiraceae bacterium]|nr:hypothetical protein [Lachnospiraceae bacterium]